MPLLSRLLPFLSLGVAIVLLAFGLWLAIHLLVIGAVVGFILFIVFAIKNALFPTRYRRISPLERRQQGRVFDHNERDE